jgi:L-arabinose transport system substrate-binding protein
VVVAVTAALTLAACSSGQAQDSPGAQGARGDGEVSDGVIDIVFIQKQGDQQYFVDEREGAEQKAKELAADGGPAINVQFVDVGSDANAGINAVNTAIAQEADAVAIVVPDARIGPQVADLLRAAGVPFVATDDPFEDAKGDRVPWVSIESLTMGRQIGKEAGQLYAEAGWSAAGTRILSIKQEDLGVCGDREKGYLETFEQEAGELPKVIEVGTDNSVPQAQEKVGAVITANPDVQNWVVLGCNEESVSGGLLALENAGVGSDQLVGVGLGAYLACKDWRAGKDTGFKASLNVDGRIDGAASIEVLVKHVRDGVPISDETLGEAVIVDAASWESAGVVCS